MMRVPENQRGAALLTVLLLVAVMSVLAAIMLDRLSIATRLAANGQALAQARLYAVAAESLAIDQVQKLVDSNSSQTTNASGWVDREFTLPFENGLARIRANDGGNCFNLNSVVSGDEGRYAARPIGITQFVSLMAVLEIDRREADAVAQSLADWIDSDTRPANFGAEDEYYQGLETPYRTANTLISDKSELRSVRGVTPDIYRKLRPWICALPAAELSPLNVNTLTIEQLPLLMMLGPQIINQDRARAMLASRPANGWPSTNEFWRPLALQSQLPGADTEAQVQVRTRWFRLDMTVTLGEAELVEQALVDAQLTPARLVQRQWGEDL